MKLSQKAKLGRKPRDDVDSCQAAYWAWWVRYKLNLDFAKIERMLDPTGFRIRDDSGGYEQPQLWRRYALGVVSPIGNGHSSKKSAVEAVEIYVPGSKTVFNSVFWKIMRKVEISEEEAIELTSQLVPEVLAAIRQYSSGGQNDNSNDYTALISLDHEALFEFIKSPHPDVLASLLIVLASKPNIEHKITTTAMAHLWLKNQFAVGKPFERVKSFMLSILRKQKKIPIHLSIPKLLEFDFSVQEYLLLAGHAILKETYPDTWNSKYGKLLINKEFDVLKLASQTGSNSMT